MQPGGAESKGREMHGAEPMLELVRSRIGPSPGCFTQRFPHPAGSSRCGSCHAVGITVCRVVGFPALAGCWEGGDVPGGRMPRASHSPRRAKPWDFWAVFHASPYAGAVGLACRATVQAVSPASAPGCSPEHSTAKSNPHPSLCATTKPQNMPITATCARHRLH